jgi:hypothetical protein
MILRSEGGRQEGRVGGEEKGGGGLLGAAGPPAAPASQMYITQVIPQGLKFRVPQEFVCGSHSLQMLGT